MKGLSQERDHAHFRTGFVLVWSMVIFMSKAIISIKGTQIVEEEPNTVEFITDGIYRHSKDTIKITYFESEMTGMDGIKTVLTADKEKIIITRSGEYKTQLILEEGKRHLCPYTTPFGEMVMGVNTGAIKNTLSSKGGELSVDYTLEMNHNLASTNRLEISVKEIKSK